MLMMWGKAWYQEGYGAQLPVSETLSHALSVSHGAAILPGAAQLCQVAGHASQAGASGEGTDHGPLREAGSAQGIDAAVEPGHAVLPGTSSCAGLVSAGQHPSGPPGLPARCDFTAPPTPLHTKVLVSDKQVEQMSVHGSTLRQK